MARFTFGGGVSDYAFGRVTAAGGYSLVAVDATTVTLWSAETGGTQYTDLLLVGGGAVTSISVPASGKIPQFQGPDGVGSMWAQATGSSARVLVEPSKSDATVAGYVNDSASSTRAALASSLSGGVTATVRFGTDPQAMLITDTLGTSGRRLSIEPINRGTSTSTAQLQLVPGAANVSSSSIPSQIQLMNKTGDNYERFSFSCVNDQYVIDSTYNGTGLARGIVIQMGGSVSNAISGQNAALFYSDASVDLNGSSYVAFGKTWGATRTRIADQNNTGDSRLVIATRTTTPTNNVADSCSIELTRGGTAKWNVGLNFSGQNVDSLDFYNRTNSSPRMQLMETGELILRGNAPLDYGGVLQLSSTVGHNWRIGEFGSAGQLLFRDVSTGNYPLTLGSAGGVGFWGHTPPATQPAAPVTLADVIAIIRGCGLSA